MHVYPVTSEDSLVVCALGRARTLRDAARELRCDPAGLLRKARRISEEHGLLTQANGKWSPTPRGRRLIAWVEESIASQRRALGLQQELRIATTAWLSERCLIPGFGSLRKRLPAIGGLAIDTPDGGFEATLRDGIADFVVVCHPPEDPAIAHVRVAPEEWVTVVPAAWAKRLQGRPRAELLGVLSERPFVRHNRLDPDALFALGRSANESASLRVDHLIGVRAAVIEGLGWSCVPRLLVEPALKRKEILALELDPAIKRDVCLWWLRDRRELRAQSREVAAWLREALADTSPGA